MPIESKEIIEENLDYDQKLDQQDTPYNTFHEEERQIEEIHNEDNPEIHDSDLDPQPQIHYPMPSSEEAIESIMEKLEEEQISLRNQKIQATINQHNFTAQKKMKMNGIEKCKVLIAEAQEKQNIAIENENYVLAETLESKILEHKSLVSINLISDQQRRKGYFKA